MIKAPRKTLSETPSQTAGPYVHIGLMPQVCGIKEPEAVQSWSSVGAGNEETICIRGTIRDGAGEIIKDACIEACSMSARNGDEHIKSWVRTACDFETGKFEFEIGKPVSTDTSNAPHIAIWIIARGINLGLHTRVYFENEDNARDPILNLVEPLRRQTLIAKGQGGQYAFDIHLQGENETVFFNF